MLLFCINFDDKDRIDLDLKSRIQEALKLSHNDSYCIKEQNINNILNFIIYDERMDRKFEKIDQSILFQRYNFLDIIWE